MVPFQNMRLKGHCDNICNECCNNLKVEAEEERRIYSKNQVLIICCILFLMFNTI